MTLDEALTAALIDSYQAAGNEVGYWGKRFLRAVKQNGGMATVKRMLQPRNEGQRKGLDALLAAKRPDLTVEAIVLQPRFRSLFTDAEISTAAERLGEYGKTAALLAMQDKLYPDELEPLGPGEKYIEGAKKQVRVNAYERDARAREACIKHYGYNCAACGFNFFDRYGQIGEHFIHVHHLKPMALIDGAYELDPIADLRPVCPNCHAMLHRSKTVLSIEELVEHIKVVSGQN